MNIPATPDPFEEELRRHPMRGVPAVWRSEVLAAATQVAATLAPAVGIDRAAAAAPWWRDWLWPCPQLWGTLAAAWVVIIVVHLANHEDTVPQEPAMAIQPSPELLACWREQRLLGLELAEHPIPVPDVPDVPESTTIPAPKQSTEPATDSSQPSAPRPHSELPATTRHA